MDQCRNWIIYCSKSRHVFNHTAITKWNLWSQSGAFWKIIKVAGSQKQFDKYFKNITKYFLHSCSKYNLIPFSFQSRKMYFYKPGSLSLISCNVIKSSLLFANRKSFYLWDFIRNPMMIWYHVLSMFYMWYRVMILFK